MHLLICRRQYRDRTALQGQGENPMRGDGLINLFGILVFFAPRAVNTPFIERLANRRPFHPYKLPSHEAADTDKDDQKHYSNTYAGGLVSLAASHLVLDHFDDA